MAPKQGKAAQNSAAASSQAASKNQKGAKKKKWSKGKVSNQRLEMGLIGIECRPPQVCAVDLNLNSADVDFLFSLHFDGLMME